MSSSKKVVLLGHFGVGKSSLIRRFVQNEFSDDYLVTIGVHILKKTIEINNVITNLIIWDIEGKEDIQKVRLSYLTGSSGFIYVIDPTRIHTYQNMNEEIEFIKNIFPNLPIITVVNKVDLIDKQNFDLIIQENKLNINFFTSAKKGDNVELLFEKLTLEMTK